MAENTNIEWTDHTFNPWIGCAKVSPGCAHCYAETLMDTRLGQVNWGAGHPRKRTSEANWKQPLKWNAKAQREGTRPRVFCASLADVFDPEVPEQWRDDLFNLVYKCKNLEWLILTKRPKLAMEYIGGGSGMGMSNLYEGGPWEHVRFGTTVENQTAAEERIYWILHFPRNFLSCEPLLGPVDLRLVIYEHTVAFDSLTGLHGWPIPHAQSENKIDWVICGGESGPHARPMQAEWARALRDQCAAANTPFHFKQWGEWAPNWYNDDNGQKLPDTEWMDKVGKKAAGRQLDGQIHHEFPIQ